MYLVTAPLVLAKDAEGKLLYHYAGSVIPWLSDADTERFIDGGLIEAADVPASKPAAKTAQKR